MNQNTKYALAAGCYCLLLSAPQNALARPRTPAPKALKAPAAKAAAPKPKAQETIGGGTVDKAAVGPKPSFGLGGPGMVLVKNWHFGTGGTIKNYADMSANFFYHDQFGTINNGGKYGSNTVSPDAANALNGQPIEGVNSPPVRQFTADSLRTFLTPLDKVTQVQVRNHNTGNGSFMAKWRLPNGGSLLGRDIVWETRVRYVTPPYFWFAIWTAGNKWKWDGQAQGAEQDLVESFGYDNGGGNTNYDGRFWHSNAVASPSKDDWNFWDWGGTMAAHGVKTFDPIQYHIWTWVYKKDNTYAMYVDGVRVQGGKDYYWTFGNTAKDEPIDMDFLFDAGWGHNQIGSVNKELPASAFDGKFYEWNYSRVYLSGGKGAGAAASAPRAVATATFVKTDTKTQGTWKGTYGADGCVIAADATRPPSYGTVTRTGWEVKWNGDGLTSDLRAPQRADGGPNDRIAGQWGTNDKSYDIDCNLTDNKPHQVALYGLDWDKNGRSEDIQIVDAATGAVLDTQTLDAYANGTYLVWNVRGHVIFRVSVTSHWTNPALSGIFFDPVPIAPKRKS